MAHVTTVTHDYLSITIDGQRAIRIARTDNGQCIELSPSEWAVLAKASELWGWPMLPGYQSSDTVDPDID